MAPTIGMCQTFILLHTIRVHTIRLSADEKKNPWECFSNVNFATKNMLMNETSFPAYILI